MANWVEKQHHQRFVVPPSFFFFSHIFSLHFCGKVRLSPLSPIFPLPHGEVRSDFFLLFLSPFLSCRGPELSAFCPPAPPLTIFLSLYCAYNTWLRRSGKRGGKEERTIASREARRSGVKSRQERSLLIDLRRNHKQTGIVHNRENQRKGKLCTDQIVFLISCSRFKTPAAASPRLKNDARVWKKFPLPHFFLPLSWRPYGSCPELGIVTPFLLFPRGIFAQGEPAGGRERRWGVTICGHRKNRREGDQKSVTGWG